MNSKVFWFVWILFLHGSVFAQQCSLKFSGTILDENDRPMPGATILFQPQLGKISDKDGRFAFDKLCAGAYQVSVQYVGYKTETFIIELNKNTERVIQLHIETEQLKEVVVQDNLSKHKPSLNYTTLTREDLQEVAGKSLGEALKDATGVNSIQTGPGIFKPVIHGVHSQRVLILNYGIRQEGQQWGAEHAPEIDPFVASNIIIVKDASAIKYGNDALGGVVIVNPSPIPSTPGIGGSVNSVIQSNGRSGTISGSVEGGIKKHEGWGWRMQGTWKRAGDFHTPNYSLTNTGLSEANFSGAFGYHKNQTGWEVYFSHFQTSLGILKGTSVNNLDDLQEAMNRSVPLYTTEFSYMIEEPRQEVSHNLLKLNGHWETEKGEWRLQYSFQNNNRQEYDIRYGDLENKPALDLRLNTHGLEAEWEMGPGTSKALCLGASGTFQKNDNVFGTSRIPFIPNFSHLSGGIFGVANFTIQSWTVDLGARYDYRAFDIAGYDFKNTLYHANYNFHNLSFSAGATMMLTDEQSLAMNISSAWRPPHVSELFSLGTHQGTASNEYGLLLDASNNEVMDINTASLPNEQALKWVSTYKADRNKVVAEVSVYANYIFNYIYLRPVGVTETLRGTLPALRYAQTDALFLGMDLSMEYKVTPQIKFIPKISLLHATDKTNNDVLVFIPPNRYETAVRIGELNHFPLDGFYVETKFKYTAKQKRHPRVIEPEEFDSETNGGVDPLEGSDKIFDFMEAPDGYFLMNVSTGFFIKTKNVKYDFRLSAENLFNTTYREYTNRFRYYADELGRNFVFSAKFIF